MHLQINIIQTRLLLRKVFYPYEYMDEWKQFNETSLPKKKKDFYNNLNMGSIIDAEYMHAKRTCNDFEIKKVWWISWFVSSKQYITCGR